MTRRYLPFAITETHRLIGFAFLAVAGLLIAGHSLFTAKGTTTIFVPAEAAATVNGVPILRDEFNNGILALYEVDASEATKAQKTEILNNVIREELYVQRARELDVANFDSDVRAAYQRAVQQFLAAKALTQPVSESKLRAFYEANKQKYETDGTMRVADYVFPASAAAKAAEISAAMRAAQGSPEAAAKFGGKESARGSAEAFYFAVRTQLGDALFAAARPLGDGAVSAPITRPDGVHLLYMIKNAPPRPQPFENVRITVLDDINLHAELRAAAGEDSALRKGAEIKIAEDLK